MPLPFIDNESVLSSRLILSFFFFIAVAVLLTVVPAPHVAVPVSLPGRKKAFFFSYDQARSIK